MALESVTWIFDLFNSFTGNAYVSTVIILLAATGFFLFLWQGDMEFTFISMLLLVLIFGDTFEWVRICLIIVLGIWAVPKVISVFNQNNG